MSISSEEVYKCKSDLLNITNPTDNRVAISASPSLSGNIEMYLPTFIGSTGQVMARSITANQTIWTSFPTVNTYPVLARDDRYYCRTNESIPINVVSGVTGNTGGADIGTIASVTIVKNVTRGTLTATGSTGNYNYRSYPSLTGIDCFMYTVTDTNGVVSKNRGLVEINIVSTQVNPNAGGTGTDAFFAGGTGIYYTQGGVQTLIYTPTYSPFAPGNKNTSMLATNRTDNLFYYMPANNNGSEGIIFAYDYVNGIEFNIGDLNAAPYNLGIASWKGGFYYRNVLYVVASGITIPIFARVFLNPYIPGVGQTFRDVQLITTNAVLDRAGDISMVYPDLIFIYMPGATSAFNTTRFFCPTSGFPYLTLTRAGEITSSFNGSFMNNTDSASYFTLNLSTMAAIPYMSGITPDDMAEWYNEPV